MPDPGKLESVKPVDKGPSQKSIDGWMGLLEASGRFGEEKGLFQLLTLWVETRP